MVTYTGSLHTVSPNPVEKDASCFTVSVSYRIPKKGCTGLLQAESSGISPSVSSYIQRNYAIFGSRICCKKNNFSFAENGI
jgi:hypothetical protein